MGRLENKSKLGKILGRPRAAFSEMEPCPYPAPLAVMLGERTFVAGDYAALCTKHGAHAVMLLRGTEVTACLVATSIVKVGALGMHTKAVPTEAVAPLLNLPLSLQTEPASVVLHLQRGLEDYLRRHTDILLD